MTSPFQALLGGRQSTKVAGAFRHRFRAQAMLEQLRNETGLRGSQVCSLRPEGADKSHSDWFENPHQPAPATATRALMHIYVICAAAGEALGLALYLWLSRFNNPPRRARFNDRFYRDCWLRHHLWAAGCRAHRIQA